MCTENCPQYELPNIFTPNGDDKNDLLQPIKNRYVKSIALTVYNRWGNKVFSTDDPQINWNGKSDGKKLSDGVYFYVCTVNEIYLSGIKPRNIRGNIHIIGNK